jgi:hypothetical protein
LKDIKCPNCDKVFQIDDSGYSAILKQVHDQEFKLQLDQRVKSEVQAAVTNRDFENEKVKNQRQKQFENEIKLRDDEIAALKDYKRKQSTKMVGESLEQHCEIEFNRMRPIGFQSAYFDKDNDAKSGSKGDYIFRDYDSDGNEYISIMFEMKNESDQTAAKKKNTDFLKELDKDRTQKNCEYAVLVSALESGNELYDVGIVDVSHLYPKMYVIRPQFFIPIITILRNTAGNNIGMQLELTRAKQQNIDITNFQSKVDDFRRTFSRNVELSQNKSDEVIEQIDKAIKSLEATKKALQDTTKYLGKANDNLTDLMEVALPTPKVKEIRG